jgi:hypothetical protein
MSINKVLVQTQYRENYGAQDWNGEGQCPQAWKPKGGFTFQIDMDADLLLYSDAAAIFGKMLESQSNNYESFEYIGYEIQWQTPKVLGTQADYIAANEALELA